MNAELFGIISSTVAIFVWLAAALFLASKIKDVCNSTLEFTSKVSHFLAREKDLRDAELLKTDHVKIQRQEDGRWSITTTTEMKDLTADEVDHMFPGFKAHREAMYSDESDKETYEGQLIPVASADADNED